MPDQDVAEFQQIVRSALRGLPRDLVDAWTQDIVGDVWKNYSAKPQAERCNLARRCARNRLAHHLRDGYQEGLRRAVAELQQIVRSALRGLPRDLVDEWTQDIVGDVWEKYRRKPQAERRKLARRMARNRLARHLRDTYLIHLIVCLDPRPDARGEAVVPGVADGDAMVAPDLAISQRQADPLEARDVRGAMRHLKKEKPRYWDVLYLQCWFDLSQAEIAHVLCVSVVDVNNWQKRGRARLLELLMRALKENRDV